MYFKLLLFLITNAFLSAACSDSLKDKPESDSIGIYETFDGKFAQKTSDTTSFYLDRTHPAVVNMRKRAMLISGIQWTAKNNIPNRSGFFKKGITYNGIPYSSVKELDKFVGLEVSFYTFITAVNNSRSVLYTEKVNELPYKGINCASYYGTVCSGAVNYALGIERPYWTDIYGSLPFIKRVAKQDFMACAPGDIVWRNGHVILITDVVKNEDDAIETIEILESTGTLTFMKVYTLGSFKKRFEGVDWILYRYANLGSGTNPTLFNFDDYLSLTNDMALCPSRGDKSSYREGEEVILNILSQDYSKLELYRSGSLINSVNLNGNIDISFSQLSYGDYFARLLDGNIVSDTVYFEIIQTDVKVDKHNEYKTISFDSSNGIPEYLVFCSENGSRSYVSDISETDRVLKYKKVKCTSPVNGLFVKVFFRGKYGRVSNKIISLK